MHQKKISLKRAWETYIPGLSPACTYETRTEKKRSYFLERKQSHTFDKGAAYWNEEKASTVLH